VWNGNALNYVNDSWTKNSAVAPTSWRTRVDDLL